MKKRLLLLLCYAASLFTHSFAQTNTFPTTGNAGIGTTTPTARLHIVTTGGTNSGLLTQLTSSSSFSTTDWKNDIGTIAQMAITGSAFSSGIFTANSANFVTDGAGGLNLAAFNTSGVVRIATGGTNSTDEKMRISANGYVGIGTTSPTAQLHTSGTVRFAGLANDIINTKILVSDANGNLYYREAASFGVGSNTWNFGGSSVGVLSKFGTIDNYAIPIITNNIERMRIGTNGNIGIGTSNISDASFKLFVETGIRTRKVKVDQSTWPDYVFNNGYTLIPLKELETFIKQYNHLPEIPSAKEVLENGLDLGENQALLLKKIEELTLYIIEIKKENEELWKEIKKTSIP